MCVNPQTNQQGNTYKCGKCSQCHVTYLQHWTFRLQREMAGKPALFLTITYDYANIPMNKGKFTLLKKDYQDWLKRLRKALPNRELKYVVCGEYGTNNNRPHYHMILIGADLNDVKEINETWGKGLIHFGTAQPASIAYTFKYSVKGSLKPVHYHQQKPFVCMSKGIGEKWAFNLTYVKVNGIDKNNKPFTRYRKIRTPKPNFQKKLDSLLLMPYYQVPSMNGGTVKMSVPKFYLNAAKYDSTELGEIFQQKMTKDYQRLSQRQKQYYDQISPIHRKGDIQTELANRQYSITKEKL
nr:MAG: replication initiator protein [Microvirus sp.]